MDGKKSRGSPKKGRGGADEFERFDVAQGEPVQGSQEFETFDVQQEPAPEPEAQLEALSDFAEEGQDVQAVLQARDEMEARLLAEPSEKAFALAEEGPAGLGNVVGVGVGEKVVDDVPTGQLAVKVFVKEKLNREEVSAEAMVPPEVGGVPTDVDATGEIRSSFYTARRRPAPCGVSIGNCNRVMAGTLGCLVSRFSQLFLLSNNHVIALVNTSPLGAGIPQPGRLDGGICPNDIIARLSQFVPILFGGGLNQVDAAIAKTSPELVDRRVLRPGGFLQRFAQPHVAPVLNMLVQKSGRTTQYRRGIVDAVSATVDVSYAPLGGVARFTGQFRVRGLFGAVFSDRGDSGSLITTFPTNQPVGLLFAGNAANNFTFGNPIARVLNAFGVQIVY
jgi:hypothetical protein